MIQLLFSETKRGVSLKRCSHGAKGDFVNNVEEANGFGPRGDGRQVRRGKGGGSQCNQLEISKAGDIGKSIDAGRGRGRSTRRQERDNVDAPRNLRGANRNRFGAPNPTPRAGNFRNGSNNNSSQINGGFRGNVNGGGGYNGPPQPARRQLGFNFASDTF